MSANLLEFPSTAGKVSRSRGRVHPRARSNFFHRRYESILFHFTDRKSPGTRQYFRDQCGNDESPKSSTTRQLSFFAGVDATVRKNRFSLHTRLVFLSQRRVLFPVDIDQRLPVLQFRLDRTAGAENRRHEAQRGAEETETIDRSLSAPLRFHETSRYSLRIDDLGF